MDTVILSVNYLLQLVLSHTIPPHSLHKHLTIVHGYTEFAMCRTYIAACNV